MLGIMHQKEQFAYFQRLITIVDVQSIISKDTINRILYLYDYKLDDKMFKVRLETPGKFFAMFSK